MTRKAFIVGHPVAHSRSPLIHGYWLKCYSIDGSYERVDIDNDNFPRFIKNFREIGFIGGNVTIPHKELAFSLIEQRSRSAEKIQAVNTVVMRGDGHIEGDNSDAFGFIANLDYVLGAGWIESINGNALVIGAGGAARAVVVGLLGAGMRRVSIANRTRARAEGICSIDPARVQSIGWQNLSRELETSELVVNTTSLGMTGYDRLDIDLSQLPSNAIVSDIVYTPLETELLKDAHRIGLRAVDGVGMLLHQAVPGFERWFGVRPEITQELRDLVITDLNAVNRMS